MKKKKCLQTILSVFPKRIDGVLGSTYPRGTAQNVLSNSSSKVMLRPCQRKSNCTQLYTSPSHLFGISAYLRIVSHTED